MHTIFDFFNRLSRNNNREWFNTHKDEYMQLRAQWIDDVQRFINIISESWPEIRYTEAKRCTYRIYRDTRFSPDKTPYKTHIGSFIVPRKDIPAAGLYLHAGIIPAENGIYTGIWHPEPAQLKKLRRAIDTNSEEWLGIVENPAMSAAFDGWFGDAVKTAPKGYDKNHPLIKYLRLKDIGVFAHIPDSAFTDHSWVNIAADKAKAALPLGNFINYSLTEDV